MSALLIRKGVEAAWCSDEFDVVPVHEEPIVFWGKGRDGTSPASQPTAGLGLCEGGVLSATGAPGGRGMRLSILILHTTHQNMNPSQVNKLPI